MILKVAPGTNDNTLDYIKHTINHFTGEELLRLVACTGSQ